MRCSPGTEGSSEVSSGRNTVGTVVFAAEKLCQPHCYTGLDIDTPGVLRVSIFIDRPLRRVIVFMFNKQLSDLITSMGKYLVSSEVSNLFESIIGRSDRRLSVLRGWSVAVQ